MNTGLDPQSQKGTYLVVDELLCRIVFLQHGQELDDIGILQRDVEHPSQEGIAHGTHVLVKRIASAIEAKDQSAVSIGTFGVRLPLARVLEGRGASETRVQFWVEDTSIDSDGGWADERDGGGHSWE